MRYNTQKKFVNHLFFLLLMAAALNCSSSRQQKEYSDYELPSISHPSFYRTISGLTGMPLLEGNKVTILNTSESTFSSLHQLLEGAKKSINMEIYIFDSDETALKTSEILIRKAKEGVKIKMLVDFIGGRFLKKSLIRRFKKAGIEFYFYEPFDLLNLRKVNERTHRKLVIVDGIRGITGGFGISDFWTKGERGKKVRDLQVLVEGPVVVQMQSIFMRNWYKTTHQIFVGESYFPEIKNANGLKARMVTSKPRNGSSAIKHAYLLSINSSRKYFWMEHSYFVPDRILVDSLKKAAGRGVDVRIILPSVSTTDSPPAVHAGRRHYDELLAAGIQICEYQEDILHAKFAVADDLWTTLGSANFDTRSFYLSSEANLEIYSEVFASRIKSLFLEDLKLCKNVSLDKLRKRGWTFRFREWFYGLWEKQL